MDQRVRERHPLSTWTDADHPLWRSPDCGLCRITDPTRHSIAVPVPPGVYFLNILNLTNSTNIYGFAETVLA